MIALIQRPSQVQTLRPPMAASLFPEIDGMLAEGTEWQKALQHVAGRKNMGKYRARVDFLFCELVTQYRGPCQRFYRGEGPPLRDLPGVTPDKVRRWQAFMQGALLVAREVLEQQRRLSWGDFRGLLGELSQAANDG